MPLKAEQQNILSAIIVGIVGFLTFLSWLMPQIQEPVKDMIQELPPEYQAMATSLVGIVIIIVYIWNYTSSLDYGQDQKEEGIVEALKNVETKKIKKAKLLDEP